VLVLDRVTFICIPSFADVTFADPPGWDRFLLAGDLLWDPEPIGEGPWLMDQKVVREVTIVETQAIPMEVGYRVRRSLG
jgi:hypothetical protein